MLEIILTHKANFSDQNDNSKICSLSTITQDEIFQNFFFFNSILTMGEEDLNLNVFVRNMRGVN